MFRRLLASQRTNGYRLCSRFFANSQSELSEGEQKIVEVLQKKFPGQTAIQVSDISGGCGSMYEVSIEAEEFRGLKTVKQHMLVNQALKTEIEQMHGMRINTKVPG